MKTALKKEKTPKEAGYYLWQDPKKPNSKEFLVQLVKFDPNRVWPNERCDFYFIGGGSSFFIPRDAIGMWSEKLEIED